MAAWECEFYRRVLKVSLSALVDKIRIAKRTCNILYIESGVHNQGHDNISRWMLHNFCSLHLIYYIILYRLTVSAVQFSFSFALPWFTNAWFSSGICFNESRQILKRIKLSALKSPHYSLLLSQSRHWKKKRIDFSVLSSHIDKVRQLREANRCESLISDFIAS